MTTIGEYLKYVQEKKDKREIGKGGVKTKPSPTFAYELVYGKSVPGGWRTGRYPGPHKTRKWKGLDVDTHLENKWLNDLNKITGVEIRGTCEGHDKDWVTYIAFRIDLKFDKDKRKLNDVINKLNKDKNTKAGWDIGTKKRPRFVCASPLYYKCPKHNEWIKWWSTIASRISKSVIS